MMAVRAGTNEGDVSKSQGMQERVVEGDRRRATLL
jgi:hypothetical protein